LEVDGPILEGLDLFEAKSGDAIREELYAFEDKGGRAVAMRAELTPTVARMVAAQAASLKKPVKWYAVPQLFRYQRQQRGRLREHIQWNVDLFGAADPAADAEVLAVAVDALRRLGLTERDVYVRLSHRALVERKLRELECPPEKTEGVLRLIDREALDAETAAGMLPLAAVAELARWLADTESEIEELAPFRAACDDFGITGFVAVDKHIVRGLAYYTGIVWEIFDRGRELRAIAGGGRYDTLVEKVGGPPLEALGFGMGDVTLTELLKSRDLLPVAAPRLDALVVALDASGLACARQVVRRLRERGVAAEAPFAPLRFNKAMKAADQSGARTVYLVKDDGTIARREDGAETDVDFEAL
jgi:histidyl-tRNA synthetase